MNGIIVVAGIMFLLVGLYISTYLLNSKTKRPEGVKELPKCSTCHISGACALKHDDGYMNEEECEFEQSKTTT